MTAFSMVDLPILLMLICVGMIFAPLSMVSENEVKQKESDE